MTEYSFKDPEMLWILLLIPVFILIAKNSLADISSSKKAVITFLRIAAFSFLVFCLAGFSKTHKNDELYVIYLIDNSYSYSEKNVKNAMKYIKDASDSMGQSDRAAVIVFGREAVVETPFSENIGFFQISSYVDKSHTNIAKAVKIAEVLFPEDAKKRIVLFTDGNENEGSAVNEVKAAVSHGIEVYAVLPEEEKSPDIRIDKLIIPQDVSVNEPFEVRVVMSGNYDGTGNLRIFMDKDEILNQEVFLTNGKKKVITFQQTLEKKGAHIFNVELYSKKDKHVENNVSQGFVFVAGEPTILYVFRGGGKSEDLIKVLEKTKIRVEAVTPEMLHPAISYLRNYDAVILDNIPATEMSTKQMESIQLYVKAIGGGLIMIGGENSFGLGGYFMTPLEKALPVEMDIKQHKKYARIAMVVIIDKSGSMSYYEKGRQKVELANEGAINVLDLLFASDVFGVIAADSVPKWAVELDLVGDKKEKIDLIASIRAGGGGIYVYSSLFEAYKKLKDMKVNLKHVILFADSADAEEPIGINGEHTYGLVSRMKEDKITVTTIAIGRVGDRDIEFLNKTANYGNGRFYFTSDMFTLPQIFTKEAFIASKSLVAEGDFVPVKKDYTSVFSVDLSAMPPLKGYVITTAKKLAVVPYETNNEDPLLAMWQYGLGRTAAFTSDAKNRWAASWIGKDGYSALWAQLVRWTLKKEESSNFDVNLAKKGNRLSISVDALDDDDNFLNFADLIATVVSPDFSTKMVSLNQTGAGRYEASEELDKSGTYFVNISRYDGSDVKESINSGISLPYLDEYKRFDINTEFLTHLIKIANGKIIKDAAEIFKHTKQPTITYITIITPLILLCIIFFVLDAMIRKITFSQEHITTFKRTLFPEEITDAPHGYEWLQKKSAEEEQPSIIETDPKLGQLSGETKVISEIEESGQETASKKPIKDNNETTLSKLLKVKKDRTDK